ncbi:MAG: hypothetical protein ACP5SH_23140 [Syntrophobacteraceae bacterium]
MDKKAMARHDIYRKLYGFSEEDLQGIVDYIDLIRRRKRLEEDKLLSLKNLIEDHEIRLAELQAFKEETWRHVEGECDDG